MKESIKDSLKSYVEKVVSDAHLNKQNYFYFYDFRHNIFGGQMDPKFEKMFLAGGGVELASKACAPHSSSMLGYNFFHWINEKYPLTIDFNSTDKNTYSEVLFEVKIPVLKKSPHPAYMDVVLRNTKGDWLFIESKFLEYCECEKFDISDTYKEKPMSYYCKGDEWTKFISKYDTSKKSQYWPGIKQEICHLIGLTNWLEGKTKILENDLGRETHCDIRFINLVFEPNEDKSDYEFFKNYKERYADLHRELANEGLIPDRLKMEFMTYSQLWENLKQSTLPDGLEKYLYEHYMQFSSAR